MGTWSAKLFDDDLAMDLKGDWHDLYAAFGAPEQASEAVITRYASSAEDEDTAATFWLALAALQHRYGCLVDEVKSRALSIIDGGEGLEEWKAQGDKALKARQSEYAKIRKEITGPAKPRKKVVRSKVETTALKPGQLVRFNMTDGRTRLLWVAQHYLYKGSTLPLCIVFDWPHAKDPTQAELDKLWPLASENEHFNFKFFRKRLGDKPDDTGTKELFKAMGGATIFCPMAVRGSNHPDYPYKQLRVLPGTWTYTPPGKGSGPGVPFWHELDRFLDGLSELHPDKPLIQPSVDALRAFMHKQCPEDALKGVAQLAPRGKAAGVLEEFKRVLAKGAEVGAGGDAANSACREQIGDVEGDPWRVLFASWWLGAVCREPRSTRHYTDKKDLESLKRELAALTIACSKLGAGAAAGAIAHALALQPPEPPEEQIPPPPDPFAFPVATLERIERHGVTKYLDHWVNQLR